MSSCESSDSSRNGSNQIANPFRNNLGENVRYKQHNLENDSKLLLLILIFHFEFPMLWSQREQIETSFHRSGIL